MNTNEHENITGELSPCCDAPLVPHLEGEESHSWSEVANAPKVCEVCGAVVPEIRNISTAEMLAEMLTKNTGIHLLDSGMASNRHWQKNAGMTVADFEATPRQSIEFWGDEAMVSLSVFHYLNEHLSYAKSLDADWVAFDKSRPDLYWMESLDTWLSDYFGIDTNRPEFYSEYWGWINTYECEFDLLGQTLQFCGFEVNGAGYVAVQIHGGADIRGGYTRPVIFEGNPEDLHCADSAMFVCGKCDARYEYQEHRFIDLDEGQSLANGCIEEMPNGALCGGELH